jgi:2,3-bisphosphoglycerate-independent phosphoglycerate mutase
VVLVRVQVKAPIIYPMHILFLFLDGVGLGADDPARNPFARAHMPVLASLLGGRRLLAGAAPFSGPQADLLSLDACLGVSGLPQSATGQAVLLTGENVPAALGYHYGPKPNPDVARFLQDGGLFGRLAQAGKRVALLNAYPPRYFSAIESGRRMYSAIPLALSQAGVPFFTDADLYAGRAISADFTGQGWHDHLSLSDAPVLAPEKAGRRLAHLAARFDFSFFEYWMSDYAGHGQDMPAALTLLEQFDAVLGGLCADWDMSRDLLILTSDHGNLEDLSTRRHTDNPVPLLLMGNPAARHVFTGLESITGVAGKISQLLRGY